MTQFFNVTCYENEIHGCFQSVPSTYRQRMEVSENNWLKTAFYVSFWLDVILMMGQEWRRIEEDFYDVPPGTVELLERSIRKHLCKYLRCTYLRPYQPNAFLFSLLFLIEAQTWRKTWQSQSFSEKWNFHPGRVNTSETNKVVQSEWFDAVWLILYISLDLCYQKSNNK